MVASDQAPPLRPGETGPGAEGGGGLGVYVHWPFCLAKCPYCDFNSHVSRTVDHNEWARALVAEAGEMRRRTGPRRAETVFFGGGTPSLMAPATVATVLDEVDRLWGLASDAEITLEANPTSVEAKNFRGYAAAGVNRVSIGVQALSDPDLKTLGRQHTVAEAEAAFDAARSVFSRVSFDLIYARRGQSTNDWEKELRRALEMAADHLSLYQLTIEQGTRFWELARAGKLVLPDDDMAAEMYDVAHALTASAGLPAYEISNHAVPGGESRHNLIYWRGGDYVGIGPGAHGRISAAGVRVALATHRDPAGWMRYVRTRGHAVAEETIVDDEEQARELALMSMRLTEGLDLTRFSALGGRLDADRLTMLRDAGLVDVTPGRVRATANGRIVLNRILEEMLE